MPSRVTTVRLTEWELQTLRLVASDLGLPVATVIRAAIADYVQDTTEGDCAYHVNTPCITPRYRQS